MKQHTISIIASIILLFAVICINHTDSLSQSEIDTLSWFESSFGFTWGSLSDICTRNVYGVVCQNNNLVELTIDENSGTILPSTTTTSTSSGPATSSSATSGTPSSSGSSGSPTSSSGASSTKSTSVSSTSGSTSGSPSTSSTGTTTTGSPTSGATSGSPSTISSGSPTSGATSGSPSTISSGGGVTTSGSPTSGATSGSPSTISSGSPSSSTGTTTTATSSGGAGSSSSSSSTTVMPTTVMHDEAPVEFVPYSLVLGTANQNLNMPYLKKLTVRNVRPVNSSIILLDSISTLTSLTTLIIKNYTIDTLVSNSFPNSGYSPFLSLLNLEISYCISTLNTIPASLWGVPLQTLKLLGNYLDPSTVTNAPITYLEMDIHASTTNFNSLSSLTDVYFNCFTSSNINLNGPVNVSIGNLANTDNLSVQLILSDYTKLVNVNLSNITISNTLAFGSTTSLKSLQLDNVRHYNGGTFYANTIPATLTNYRESNGIVTGLPSSIVNIRNLDLHGNVGFNPVNTDVLCTVDTLNLKSTGLSSSAVSKCFSCYQNEVDMSKWFDSGVIPAFSQPTCASSATVSPLTTQSEASGKTIRLTGTLLGWGSSSIVTKNLTKVVPNTKFDYIISPKPTNLNSSKLIQVLTFSNWLSVSFEITYTSPVIQSVNFAQSVSGFLFSINGIFFESPTFKVGGVNCPIATPGVTDGSQTTFTCNMPSTLAEGLVIIEATGATHGSVQFEYQFVRRYPIVTSVGVIGTSGGILSIFGNFDNTQSINTIINNAPGPILITNNTSNDVSMTKGIEPSPVARNLLSILVTSIIVNINGTGCAGATMQSSSLITCTVAAGGVRGPKLLEVSVDGYTFTSSDMLFLGLLDAQNCTDDCGSNGHCDQGRCVCDSGYGGPTCVPDKSSGVKINSAMGNTNPSGQMTVADNIQLKFKAEAVQELDISGNLVAELKLPSNWSTSIKSEGATYTSFTYDMSYYGGNTNVTAVMTVFTGQTVVNFASTNYTYNAGTMKLSLAINNWPYHSSINTLRVLISAQVKDTRKLDACGNPVSHATSMEGTVDDWNNMKYMMMNMDSVSFYGRFLDVALSDGRPIYSRVSIVNSTSSQGMLGISLPHCRYCVLDPDLSVLVKSDINNNDNECTAKKSKGWVIAVAVVIPVVVIGAAIVAVFVIRKRFYIQFSGKKVKFVNRSRRDKIVSMNHL